MSTSEECQAKFESEVSTFEAVAYFSIGLTFASFVATVFFKQRLVQNPAMGWKIYFTLAGLKILIGILLFSALVPTCPSGCLCGSYTPSYVYPTIVLFVGVMWVLRGSKYFDLDRNGPRQVENAGAVQGTEMKDTSNDIV